tara:strand:- start:4414 stop:5355 length:942 start_codon:yes stop_codon:yes gene_type:complete
VSKLKKIFFVFIIASFFTAKVSAKIDNALFIAVGDIPITKHDVVNEIKKILILTNTGYSEEKRDKLNELAISAMIKRNIKKIEIEKNDFLEFSQKDLNFELNKLASGLNMDLDTLKDICKSNGLEFSLISDQIKIELLWQSLIFHLYKGNISINADEIEEQLKLIQDKKEFTEYLISEIVISHSSNEDVDAIIKNLKERIEIEGFENVAMEISISDTNIKGGDLGWVDETIISEKLKSIISNTQIGMISEPVVLSNGVLIVKVRDKRISERKINLEETKDKLVKFEKNKILNMYSMSHYDKLRRSTPVKFFNE